jgi:hypothetical protein
LTKKDAKQFEKYLKEAADLIEPSGSTLVDRERVEEKAHWLFTRWKAMHDFYYFTAKIMGLERARDAKSRRKRLDPKLHRKMCNELQSDEDTLQLYPRLHLKSTLIKYFIIWRIILNPMIRVGFWSRNTKLVRKELRHIKVLCRKEILQELWPEIFVPQEQWDRDNADELTIYRDPDLGEAPQEAQVEVWGIESTVTGHHYDIHIYDDIINEKSVTNAPQIEKVQEWWEMVQAIKELTAIEKMIGTRYHLQDVYGHVMNEGFFDKVTVMPAIIGNKPIYSFFTMKDLERLRKRMGEYAFSTQFMNNVVPKGRRIFIPPYPCWETMPASNRTYYISVDPAPSRTSYSNETAIAVAFTETDTPNRVFYQEVVGYREKPDEVARILVDKIDMYRPRRVGIELGLQLALQSLIDLNIRERERQIKDYIRPKFVEISVGNTPKPDKFNRTIAAFMRQGRAFFRADMKRLFRQFDSFNPFSKDNNDDLIDSCSMIIQTIEHFAQSHWLNVNDETPNMYGMTMEEIFEYNKTKRLKEKAQWGWKFKSA